MSITDEERNLLSKAMFSGHLSKPFRGEDGQMKRIVNDELSAQIREKSPEEIRAILTLYKAERTITLNNQLRAINADKANVEKELATLGA